MESTCFLLQDKQGKDHAIFTGDTLFLGDVGRPDLAQTGDLATEDLAGLLYDSLRTQIMTLNDDLIIYPAHGAGSACGKNMMSVTVDTLGNQKRVNYALRADMTKAEFISELTTGVTSPPPYFPANVKLNKEGYPNLDTILQRGSRALSPLQFEKLAHEKDLLILDVRPADSFIEAHIPNSIFIGLEGNFAPWVGELLIDVKQPLLLVAPEGKIKETLIRLARIGFDNTLGYLNGGIEAWQKAAKTSTHLTNISALSFADQFKDDWNVIDLRRPEEYKTNHIRTAKNIPLRILKRRLNELSKSETFYVHCKAGYRSVIGASILKANGIGNVINVQDGFDALKETFPSLI